MIASLTLPCLVGVPSLGAPLGPAAAVMGGMALGLLALTALVIVVAGRGWAP